MVARFKWLEFPEKGKEIPEFEKELLEEHDAQYYLQSGERKYWEGEYESALKDYSLALRQNRGLIPAWVGQVKALIELKELKEARVWSDKALNLYPRSSNLLAAKAVLLTRLKKSQEALTYSDASLGYDSSTEYVWLARGEVHLGLKRENIARFCFDKVLEANPKSWILLSQVGTAYLSHRHFAWAKEYLTQATQLHSTSPILWFRLGQCYHGLRFPKSALFYYEKANKLNPYLPGLRKALEKARRGRCFVATVAFGSSLAPEVVALRKFRDSTLKEHNWGKYLIEIYYRVGPRIARSIEKHSLVKKFIRWSIQILLKSVRSIENGKEIRT